MHIHTHARMHVGMTHSNARETVSLFEGARSIVQGSSRFPSYYNSGGGSGGGGGIYNGTTCDFGDGDEDEDDDDGNHMKIPLSSNSAAAAAPVQDETLVILDRLRELTEKAQQLQVRRLKMIEM